MIVVATMAHLYLVALPAVLLYAYWYDGRHIIGAAIMLDALYGAFDGLPILSLSALCVYVAVEILSPRLRTL